jgi:ribosomal protein S18 acetylase RimI-like enzyme
MLKQSRHLLGLVKKAKKVVNKLSEKYPNGLPLTSSEKAALAMCMLASKPELDQEDLMIIRGYKKCLQERAERDIRWENKTGEFTVPDMRLEVARWDGDGFILGHGKYKDILVDEKGIYYHFTDIDNEDTDNSGGLLGFIISKDKKTAFVQIYLEPDYRGLGLPYPLLVLFANLNKLDTVQATINKSNIASIKSCKKMGFEIDNERRNYLINKGLLQEDQIRLVKEFNRKDIEVLGSFLFKNHSIKRWETKKVKALQVHRFHSLRGLVGYIPNPEFKQGDFIG